MDVEQDQYIATYQWKNKHSLIVFLSIIIFIMGINGSLIMLYMIFINLFILFTIIKQIGLIECILCTSIVLLYVHVKIRPLYIDLQHIHLD